MPHTRAQAAAASPIPSSEEYFSPETKEKEMNQHINGNVNKIVSQEEQASPLARATAVHMNVTSILVDQITELKRLTMDISKHIIKESEDFKPDVKDLLAKVPRCNGTDPNNLVEFMLQVQEICELKLSADSVVLSSLINYVDGELRCWWADVVPRLESWKTVKIQLIAEFLSPVMKLHLINAQVRRVQQTQESLSHFISDIWRRAEILEANISEQDIILHIWTNANYETLLKLKDRTIPISIQGFKLLARQIEEMEMLLNLARHREGRQTANTNVNNEEGSVEPRCYYCNMRGHMIAACRRRKADLNNKSKEPHLSKND